MTAKEYLSQAYRLDQRINSNIEEVTMLREMASSISSPSWGEKVQTSRSTEAPFVKCPLLKILYYCFISYLFYEQRKTCPIRKVVVGLMRFSLQSVLTDTPRNLAMRDNVSPLFTL